MHGYCFVRALECMKMHTNAHREMQEVSFDLDESSRLWPKLIYPIVCRARYYSASIDVRLESRGYMETTAILSA